MPRAHFDPKAFEVSTINKVSNIYRNVNKFLPNTIKYFTRQRLLQRYLLPIITRKDRSNLFYLYYRSFQSNIALVIHFRLCLFTSQMHPRIAQPGSGRSPPSLTLRNEWLRNGHIRTPRKQHLANYEIRSSVTKSADCYALRMKFRKSGPWRYQGLTHGLIVV